MSLITASFGTPNIADFNDQKKNKFFCEVVQGDVSNLVRPQNSVAFKAGTEMPTGSIAWIDSDNKATDSKTGIPQIVFVGTEHGNVKSEKYNSGCGLITLLPLNSDNVFMTTVFDPEGTYTVGAKLYVKKVNGVNCISTAVDGDVVGIVKAFGKHHLGQTGVVFTANWVPAN